MIQNLKVDIVYYKGNTDFELEFNLCGCCRMRLLTDKAIDKKSLVNNLSRAVGRSRVIIVIGNLFGEDGTIEVSAKAIGKGLSKIDNKRYGISGNDEIKIINGATPLVTPDGFFGGCVIESGPQSMILLSDNKAVRKTIMNILIHPYIEDIYAADLRAKAETKDAPPEAIMDEDVAVEETAEEIEETTEETAEEIAEEAAEEAETESEDIFSDTSLEAAEKASAEQEAEETEEVSLEETEEVKETVAETEDVKVSGNMTFETDDFVIKSDDEEEFDDDYELEYDFDSDDDEEEEFYEKRPKKGKSKNLPILIISIILFIIIAVLCYAMFYVPFSLGTSPVSYLKDIFTTLFK